MTKLTDEERQQGLKEVLDAGWTMVKGRDAIYREFLFKDFNQVSKKKFSSFKFINHSKLDAPSWPLAVKMASVRMCHGSLLY